MWITCLRVRNSLALGIGTSLILALASIAPGVSAASEEGFEAEDRRWEESIAGFAAADRENTPTPDGVVFVGSSSIRLWRDLQAQLKAKRRVLNRGLGGARIADCTRYLDRLVFPHAPRQIVIYAGDNDLAEGRPPKQVLNDFVRFVAAVRKKLPATRIVYISIKPSPARARLIAQAQQANHLIRRFIQGAENMEFIDVFTPMLDDGGRPRAELFQDDALHLNSAGYHLWASLIGPHVR